MWVPWGFATDALVLRCGPKLADDFGKGTLPNRDAGGLALQRERLTDKNDALSKVARVTLAFWIIKILATTLGETGGDALSMSLHLGYAESTLIFFGIFIVVLAAQVTSDKYHPALYWAVIVATTTAGTTLSDYLDRTLGLGYPKAS